MFHTLVDATPALGALLPAAVDHVRLADGRRVALHPRPATVDEGPLRGFVVTADGRPGSAVVAEACYRRQAFERSAEFALAVDPAWRRAGLGSALVEALCRAARHEGLRSMVGRLPPGASAAQLLLERCGFDLDTEPDDHGLLCAHRSLPPRQATLQAEANAPDTVSGWLRPQRDTRRRVQS